MWHYHHDKLKDPVDFLKVGHGSHNTTPWVPEEIDHPINAILTPWCQRAVIRQRSSFRPRVVTRRQYDEPEHPKGRMSGKKWKKYNPDETLVPESIRQPLRIDLEYQKTNSEVPFIDVRFEGA